jgi:hypothetical protein
MKSEKTRRCPHHVRAMKGQTRLTTFSFTRSPSQSSHLASASSSPALSRAVSRVPSVSSSRVPLLAPSPVPSSNLPSSQGSSPAPSLSSRPAFEEIADVPSQSPVEVDDSGSDAEGGDDAASLNDDEARSSEGEEEDVDQLLDAVGPEPKATDEVHGWEELRKQIKEDLVKEHGTNKKCMNQLTILRNFATLRIKGLGRIAASEDIMQQWHKGTGVHFAHWIRLLACHYQHFEQLPIENRGGDRGQSLLNDERIQTAARTHLMSLAKGEVTPKWFHHSLNTEILPILGYPLAKKLSERTAR